MNMPQNAASTELNTAPAAPKAAPSKTAAPTPAPQKAETATKAAAPAPQKASSPAKAAKKVSSAKTSAAKPSTSKPSTSKSLPPKPAVKAEAKPAAKAPVVKKQAAAPAKPLKDKKVKVVRDSFTIPKTELIQIVEMKKRALTLGVGVKKSELIRAGLSALAGMNDAAFKKAIASVPTIKTGRPAKD